MEQYLVSARKYRPSTFSAVIGQKALTSTLKNAIATGRLAHSDLFCGSRGVGKTSCARIFAKTINCEHPTADGEACNECDSCRSFNKGTSLNIIEMDAASNNGVDDMRALTDQVLVPPANGRFRVFIIDEVHMLTAAAFNAFLKTLEEPPAHAIFILATTEKHKIIPTILSRCQTFDFNAISIRDMVEHMADVAAQEGITADKAALGVIARKADGAMRDALSIFDQVAASMRGNITYEGTLENLNVLGYEQYTRLTEAFVTGDVMATWLIYKDIRDRGFDSHFFLCGIGDYLRDLMVSRDASTRSLLNVSPEAEKAMSEMAAKCSPDFLLKAMSIINDADLAYRTATNKQFLVEVTLARLCQLCSPSADKSGNAEGQLKPIARPQAPAKEPAPVKDLASQAAAPQQQQIVAEPAAPIMKPTTAPASKPVSKAAYAPKAPRMNMAAATNAATADSDAPAAQQQRTTPFTPEDLTRAWNGYIAANPTAHVLINAMRMAAPRHDKDFTYIVPSMNGAQQDVIADGLSQILPYLRDTLQNDLLALDLRIEEGELPPSAWTPREVLEHMLQDYPVIADYIADFGLRPG